MSLYPDGSVNLSWTRFRVVVPHRNTQEQPSYKIAAVDIDSIVCHRFKPDGSGLEQYLVRWSGHSGTDQRPHSWHDLPELADVLIYVQRYIDNLSRAPPAIVNPLPHDWRRKAEDGDLGRGALRRKCSNNYNLGSTSNASATVDAGSDVFNATISRVDGRIQARAELHAHRTPIHLPSHAMILAAAATSTRQAQFDIRTAFDSQVAVFAKKTAPLDVLNQVDGSRPTLAFKFIESYIFGPGTSRIDDAVLTGCGEIAYRIGSAPSAPHKKCVPNMGQGIGCEYSRVCDCLEYAAVDSQRLTQEEQKQHAKGDGTGLPKRFPYLKDGTLQAFYLHSRNVIYECNQACRCGPVCKTRLVQKGRTVSLQIFKTQDRGWGLRSTKDLRRGQFIDTYRGEIITDAEATRREEQALAGTKASYLYALDKFDIAEDERFTIDGEAVGGPTRFMNHSCNPKVRQYTVSYNKYDHKVYELAFFAIHDIPALTELAFDYQDLDDVEESKNRVPALSQRQEVNSDTQQKLECRCGSDNCRGTLWL